MLASESSKTCARKSTDVCAVPADVGCLPLLPPVLATTLKYAAGDIHTHTHTQGKGFVVEAVELEKNDRLVAIGPDRLRVASSASKLASFFLFTLSLCPSSKPSCLGARQRRVGLTCPSLPRQLCFS